MIVDTGASCHMCCDKEFYETLEDLKHPIEVSVGDGCSLKATGRGIIYLKMELPNEKVKKCQLLDVLYVPQLPFNLLSVSKATEADKSKFNKKDCQIYNAKGKLIAEATKDGSLYYINGFIYKEKVNVVDKNQKK